MTTSSNPWLVASVHDFWFLRCPECPFETKEEEFFEEHAIENHPASLALFVKTVKEEALEKNYELEEHNQDYIESYDFRQGSTETLFVSSNPPEVQIKEENISDDEHEHKESVHENCITPPHNQTSEAVAEDEDNAKQNLLDDTRGSYEPQFDDDFTETWTKKEEAKKQKNSDYLCYNCKAICCSFKDLQKHIESCSTKKSTKQSNLAIAKMAKNSCFKKQTAKKSNKVAVPMVPRVPTGQQAGIVSLPRGQQVRQQINAQPVPANAAVSSAGGHHIRVSAPGIQTRPPLAGVRNVVSMVNSPKRMVAVPRVSTPIVVTHSQVPARMPSQQAIILRSGQQTGIVALPGGQQGRQQVNTPPVLVNATVSSAGIQTKPPLAGGHNVVFNQSGTQISVPLQVLKSILQAGKFFCQMAEFYVKFSS